MQRLLEIARTGEILTLAAPIILAILADHHSRDTSREKVSADLLKHSRPLFALLSPEKIKEQRSHLTSVHFVVPSLLWDFPIIRGQDATSLSMLNIEVNTRMLPRTKKRIKLWFSRHKKRTKIMRFFYQVHLIFLAWSQTSWRRGSYWTITVFSMYEHWGDLSYWQKLVREL